MMGADLVFLRADRAKVAFRPASPSDAAARADYCRRWVAARDRISRLAMAAGVGLIVTGVVAVAL